MAREKVTYANLTAESDELHARLDSSLATVRVALAQSGAAVTPGDRRGEGVVESLSPIDTRLVVARFEASTRADVTAAVATARRGYPAWRARPWSERAQILGRAAAIVRDRSYDL